jgi:arylsulfatase A-like enzyme
LDVDIYQRMMRDYMQTVAAVDDSVGEVLKHLEDKGVLDNTLIVYTSD